MPKSRLSLFDPSQKSAQLAESSLPQDCGRRASRSPGSNLSESNPTRRDRELDRAAGVAAAKTVALPLASLVPLLAEAAESDRAWLKDFADDMVRIDADLYEVLLAYHQLRDRAA